MLFRQDFFLYRVTLCMSFYGRRHDNLLQELPNPQKHVFKKSFLFTSMITKQLSYATKAIFHSDSLTKQYILIIRIIILDENVI